MLHVIDKKEIPNVLAQPCRVTTAPTEVLPGIEKYIYICGFTKCVYQIP